MTNVPVNQFLDTGVLIPAVSDVLTGVQADINSAFGGKLSNNLETPQGQLATSITAIKTDSNDQLSLLANNFNPELAQGSFQDAIGNFIVGFKRKTALATTVQCTVIGAVGATVNTGDKVADTNGNTYEALGDTVIGSMGYAIATFACTKTGAIYAPAMSVTTIYSSMPGIDKVYNLSDGIVGRGIESQRDFEIRRKASVAMNGHGSAESIQGEVFNVDGVIDCYVYDNPSNSVVSVGSTMQLVGAHSVYVCVAGGQDSEIAAAIARKKDLGCGMAGTTTAYVTRAGAYNTPPTDTINFQRPASTTIKFAVQIQNNPALPANILTLVATAIQDAFIGGYNVNAERIGDTIFASKYYKPVESLDSNCRVVSIKVGIVTATLDSVAVGVNQFPVCNASDVVVTLV